MAELRGASSDHVGSGHGLIMTDEVKVTAAQPAG
jgi:hypothetical protein